MPEEKKKAKLETVKENSRFLRGTIAEELARDTSNFSSDNAGLLKFHGTYQQDDRGARKQREGSRRVTPLQRRAQKRQRTGISSRMRRIRQWLATGKRSAHVPAAAEEP